MRSDTSGFQPLSSSVVQPGVAGHQSQQESRDSKAAKADIEVDSTIVSTLGKELAEEINKHADWGDAESREIEEAMNKIESWKKRFDKIQEKGWAMQRNDIKYDLKSTRVVSSMALIRTLKAELAIVIDNIKFEDESRCLYSLCKAATASVKFPTFSGSAKEDFVKFKQEFEKCLKSNKVQKDDQIKKLRENLKDPAKGFIPEAMKDIEDAWSVLEGMYGDAVRVIDSKKTVVDLGPFPKSGKGVQLLRKQVSWLSQLELTLKEIRELGNQNVCLDREAFGLTLIREVKEFFPFIMQGELTNLFGPAPVDGKAALDALIDYSSELREQRRQMLTDKEAGEVKNGGAGTGTTDTGLGGAGTGAGLGAGASRQKGNVRSGDGRGDSRNVTANYTAALIYNPPQRDENCRICLTLEADGDTTDLYDDHTQNFATGCPRLAAMSQKDKNVIVRKAKLCINCLDPEFVYKFGNFHKQCPVREKKRHYTCKAVKCRTDY